jgi:hypothetical protein
MKMEAKSVMFSVSLVMASFAIMKVEAKAVTVSMSVMMVVILEVEVSLNNILCNNCVPLSLPFTNIHAFFVQ